MKVFGIPNCDTVKKARAWLDAQGLAYTFHDYKKQGVPPEVLDAAAAALGWDALINRRGTTWRKLDAAAQAMAPAALVQAHPSVIRRPLVQWPDGRWTVGFDAQAWATPA